MDDITFDRFARSFSAGPSRRTILGLLASATFGRVADLAGREEAEARGKKKGGAKKKGKKHHKKKKKRDEPKGKPCGDGFCNEKSVLLSRALYRQAPLLRQRRRLQRLFPLRERPLRGRSHQGRQGLQRLPGVRQRRLRHPEQGFLPRPRRSTVPAERRMLPDLRQRQMLFGAGGLHQAGAVQRQLLLRQGGEPAVWRKWRRHLQGVLQPSHRGVRRRTVPVEAGLRRHRDRSGPVLPGGDRSLHRAIGTILCPGRTRLLRRRQLRLVAGLLRPVPGALLCQWGVRRRTMLPRRQDRLRRGVRRHPDRPASLPPLRLELRLPRLRLLCRLVHEPDERRGALRRLRQRLRHPHAGLCRRSVPRHLLAQHRVHRGLRRWCRLLVLPRALAPMLPAFGKSALLLGPRSWG